MTDESMDDASVKQSVSAWYHAPIATPRSPDDIVRAVQVARRAELRRRRQWTIVGGALAAAAVFVLVSLRGAHRYVHSSPSPSDSTTVRFVYIAPSATSRVTVVGDFNGWNASATPLERTNVAHATAWATDMRLPPGRHTYAFVVNGTQWVPDPASALAPDDGFGTMTSVIVVGGAKGGGGGNS